RPAPRVRHFPSGQDSAGRLVLAGVQHQFIESPAVRNACISELEPLELLATDHAEKQRVFEPGVPAASQNDDLVATVRYEDGVAALGCICEKEPHGLRGTLQEEIERPGAR